MSSRRIVGVLVAVACVAGAVVVTRMQQAGKLAAAEAQAHADAMTATDTASQELAAQAKSLATAASAGAELDGIGQTLSTYANVPDLEAGARSTLEDVFKNEAWWEPYRKRGDSYFFVGGRALYAEHAELAPALRNLVAFADTGGTTGLVVHTDGKAYLAGAGRVSKVSKQQEHGVVVLVAPLSLEAAATKVTGALSLGEHDKAPLLTGGTGITVTALREFLAKPSPQAPCCAARPLAESDGLELVAYKDPTPLLEAAARDSARLRWPVFGGAGVIALVALALAFRKREVAQAHEQLLRDTAAQLEQSREELRRLSQRLSPANGTTSPNAPAPIALSPSARISGEVAAADDGLGATSASLVSTSRYEVVAPLGEGGMARVSVAVVRGAEGFRRLFVVKRLRPELVTNRELVNQFIDEARLGASLVHSNIVPVFDFGRDAEGYYIAQEYILGRDVDAVVQASLETRKRALEPAIVLAIALEGLKALSYAHTRRDDAGKALGLVHRDVSPNNLMVSARGEVKLLDFGIVKGAERLTKTKTGVVKGNLYFMSPEQARGLDVDARSDLFSLGLVLFYAATGATLYSGSTSYELITRAAQGLLEADWEKVRALPAPLPELIASALQMNPGDRPATAEEMAKTISGGPMASAVELQGLMEQLFKEEFAAERTRFTVRDA